VVVRKKIVDGKKWRGINFILPEEQGNFIAARALTPDVLAA